MVISGDQGARCEIKDVLIGEVWLCAGQSNMQMGLAEVDDGSQEVAKADYPAIRLFPGWRVCTPANVAQGGGTGYGKNGAGGFSAVSYFFGREIHQTLKVPVGLICTAHGGSLLDRWAPPDGDLYKDAVAPLVPMAMRGLLWYQGEADCANHKSATYAVRMKNFIVALRKVWGQGDFPVYYVQIVPFDYVKHNGVKTPDELPLLWEAQLSVLSVPNTGMAATFDLGEDHNIHPVRKQAVGHRLALLALAKTYQRNTPVCSGPIFRSMQIEDGSIRIDFDHVGEGLVASDGKPLSWFEIAGTDGKYVPAEARIEGKQVVVSSKAVPAPKAVRFGWNQTASPNLANKEGLPALPFRSAEAIKTAPADRMSWWRDARFGMFIHWGIYSVPARGEWHMHLDHVPTARYEKYAEQFRPERFDAQKWVSLAKEAGMKYLVITSKHHDGFCMFRTQATRYNVVDGSPWRHDPLKDLADECRRQGIKFCVYYSIMDWHHPDQMPANDDPEHPSYNDNRMRPGRKDHYVECMKTQLHELITQYHPAVIWFDGQWPGWWENQDGWNLYQWLRKEDPQLIISNRVKGAGDFGTPEQNIPATGIGGDWETCMTINESWGYHATDDKFKSAESLLRNLIDIASKGGNYLLNVGPTAEGITPQPQADRLQVLGQWMKVNGEAIYGTRANPVGAVAWGRITAKFDPDTTRLYLHVFDWPAGGTILVPELQNEVVAARLLDGGQSLETKRDENGLNVRLPAKAPSPIASVVVLEIKGKPRLVKPPVRQATDGSLTLMAKATNLPETGVSPPKIEGPAENENIGFWTDPRARVEWTIQVNQPGTFDVAAVVATPGGGVRITITAGDARLEAAIPKTGVHGKYTTAKLGRLEVKQPGRQVLVIQPQAAGWIPINLRQLVLTPMR